LRTSPWCPVEALERWLAANGRRTTGPVFVGLRRSRHCHTPGEQRLSDRAVARVVKAAAAAAGLPGDWAGHSLRRGMITTALEHGVAPHVVQGHARHRTVASTLEYGEAGQAIERHPGVGLGSGERQLPDDRSGADGVQARKNRIDVQTLEGEAGQGVGDVHCHDAGRARRSTERGRP